MIILEKKTESEDYPSTGLFWWAASSVLDTGLDPSALLQDQTTTEVKAELVSSRHTRSLSVAATNQDSHQTTDQAALYFDKVGRPLPLIIILVL